MSEGLAGESAECRGCGRRILWGQTPTGARVPLDPETHRGVPFEGPPPEGWPWAQGYAEDGRVVRVHTTQQDGAAWATWAPLVGVRVSHFATCPEAARFSRRKGRTAP
jgi:hypothetical protein